MAAKILTTFFFAILLCLTGCAAPLKTASGRPEVVIENVSRRQVFDFAVAEGSRNGFEIRDVSEYHLVMGKRDQKNIGAAMLFGSQYDTIPEIRLTFTAVEQPSGVMLRANGSVITNPGSAFERQTDLSTGTGAHELQAMLERIRNNFNPWRSAETALPAKSSSTQAVTDG